MSKNFIDEGVIEAINQRLDDLEGKVTELEGQSQESATADTLEDIKSELTDLINDAKSELNDGIEDKISEFNSNIEEVQSQIGDLENRVSELEGIETIE